MNSPVDVVVIGGGFYGLRVALHLREREMARSVVVLEREPEVMVRASYVNQARVHVGYHYPRSVLTGYRSRVNYPAFLAEFGDAVVRGFPHYYAIARTLSKTNARQFAEFCRRIGAPVAPAPAAVARLFDPGRVERVFEVREPAFDATLLRRLLLRRIESVGGVVLRTSADVRRMVRRDGAIDVLTSQGDVRADRVIGAVYAGTNALHAASGVPTVGVQHEFAELALVELPEPLNGAALTVMDGPFFSMMPFPDAGLHSLSHVRYTVHHRWSEQPGAPVQDPYARVAALPRRSAFPQMRADIRRFLRIGEHIRHDHSLYEVKTVLTRSSDDDSRPILFQRDHGMSGYTCIMGSKLDNVYDVLAELEDTHGP